MTTTIDRRSPRTGDQQGSRPRGRPADGPPPMDPRLRQRRTAVLRDQGRRRLRILVGLVSVPGLVLVGLLVLRSSWLSVDQVTVTGAHRTPVSAVERSVATAVHHPLVSANLGRLEAEVEELPWVQRATVRRSWPSTLAVTVTERVPVATVGEAGRFAELDATGRVLAVVGPAPVGQPRLAGSIPAALAPGAMVGPQLRRELDVAAALPSSLRSQVSGVGPEAGGGVELTLAGTSGARVELGDGSDLAVQLAALQTVLAQVDLTGVSTIDLRVPGQPALTRS